uniref:Nucleolar GTP-binding protein 1 Rossman-fold domain-containing protein n=1 Tax=Kalanchoe fedtschenkoi TaxID=63787 RepID=A0A7N0RI01_KALFE
MSSQLVQLKQQGYKNRSSSKLLHLQLKRHRSFSEPTPKRSVRTFIWQATTQKCCGVTGIMVQPAGKDFIHIILTRTQRQTPAVVQPSRVCASFICARSNTRRPTFMKSCQLSLKSSLVSTTYILSMVIKRIGYFGQAVRRPHIIEMCSITALGQLRAAVLFFLDISGSCGCSAALFHSIKSFFMNKPLIIVSNKTDLQPLDGISEEDKKLVAGMKSEALKTLVGHGGEATSDEGVLLTMSTLTEDGVITVKNAACERLLEQRVELKMNSKKIKKTA